MTASVRYRNIPILSISQALAGCGPAAVALLGGIIGTQIAPNPTLATLPSSMYVIGTAVATIPSAYMMKLIGRRNGFMLGAFIAASGALLTAFAVAHSNFLLYCLGIFSIGFNGAFVLQYRFAAAESVEPTLVSRAVSFVLLGGVVAGFLGPEIAKRSLNLEGFGAYSGPFISVALIYAIVFLIISRLKPIETIQIEKNDGERPLKEIVLQPVYLLALLAGIIAYGVMSFLMTATPITMHVLHDFSIDQTTLVIQSHVVAMYLPSLFTGMIIEHMGVLRVIVTGLLLLLACSILAFVSQEFIEFWGALVLLGIGWNFLFVGATVLLTRSYRRAERFKSQAVNDFSIFGIQALASLSAGSVLFLAGWQTMSILTLIPMVFLLLVLIFGRGRLSANSMSVINPSPLNPGD